MSAGAVAVILLIGRFASGPASTKKKARVGSAAAEPNKCLGAGRTGYGRDSALRGAHSAGGRRKTPKRPRARPGWTSYQPESRHGSSYRATGNDPAQRNGTVDRVRRLTTETKQAFKTTEFGPCSASSSRFSSAPPRSRADSSGGTDEFVARRSALRGDRRCLHDQPRPGQGRLGAIPTSRIATTVVG